MSEQIETVGTMLPKEIERCAKIVETCKSLGNFGILGATMIQADIDYAHRTIAEQDVVGMIQALQKLKGCK